MVRRECYFTLYRARNYGEATRDDGDRQRWLYFWLLNDGIFTRCGNVSLPMTHRHVDLHPRRTCREPADERAVSLLTKTTALATLLLIFVGSLVTSTGSGLAVPDWPLSYGTLFPPIVGGILYEHGHRMAAAVVGLLVVVQALVITVREPRRWVRVLAWVAVGTIVAQGVLGGLTVLFLLPTPISMTRTRSWPRRCSWC